MNFEISWKFFIVAIILGAGFAFGSNAVGWFFSLVAQIANRGG